MRNKLWLGFVSVVGAIIAADLQRGRSAQIIDASIVQAPQQHNGRMVLVLERRQKANVSL